MAALGEDFRRARESRSLALSDVAEQLHIRSEFLAAIEDERWAEIGDVVSLRGLLRTYARFLGLDGGAMVERFNEDHASLVVAPALPSQPKSLDLKAFGGVLVGVAAIIILYFSLTSFIDGRLRVHHDAVVAVKPSPAPSPVHTHAATPTAAPTATAAATVAATATAAAMAKPSALPSPQATALASPAPPTPTPQATRH